LVSVDPSLCGYCGSCVSVCPVGALDLQETRLAVSEACVECNLCLSACPMGALVAATESPRDLPMLQASYDVVVVGAGPAGSTAAWQAAEQGLSVLLLEKRQEIGSPVRCAEGIGHEGLSAFFAPDRSWVSATVRKIRIQGLIGGQQRLLEAESQQDQSGGVGYILERRVFDCALAERAAQAGADVLVKSAATAFWWEGDSQAVVQVQSPWGHHEISARVVIGADGVESRLGAWAGLDTTLARHDLMSCAQFLLAGVDIDPECTYYYLDSHLAPGGYIWIFPKGSGCANVGLGAQSDLVRIPPVELLTRFVESQPFLERGSAVTLVAGGVPVGLPPPRLVSDGCLLVGDAARQVDPITGGGIANAMSAGRLAAQVAAQAIESDDVSQAFLSRYEQEWAQGVGRRMARNYRLRRAFAPEQRTSERFWLVFAISVGAAK